MFRRFDPTPADGVVVDILYLLAQHVVTGNQLGMAAFLPHLMLALVVVLLAVIGELVQDSLIMVGLRRTDEIARRVPFEGLHHAAQVGRFGDEVEMVLHDDVRVELESLLAAAVGEGVEEDVAVGFVDEGG